MAKTIPTPAATAESLRLRPRFLWFQNHKLSRSSIERFPYLVIKRIFDIIFAMIGCALLVPIAIVIKIAYLLSGDRHPIIYVQSRIGKNGKIFRMYKFRSMAWNADKKLKKILATNPKIRAEYRLYKKIQDDPRITKVGKIIRKCSIDEIPQFINVLKGEMSLVGNRPYLVSERKGNQKYLDKIAMSKPGITGLWQVSGHNSLSFRKRLEIESSYSEIASITTDIKIFFKTFSTIFNELGGNTK